MICWIVPSGRFRGTLLGVTKAGVFHGDCTNCRKTFCRALRMPDHCLWRAMRMMILLVFFSGLLDVADQAPVSIWTVIFVDQPTQCFYERQVLTLFPLPFL